MATGAAAFSLSASGGGVNTHEIRAIKSTSFVKTPVLTFPAKPNNHQGRKSNLTVVAQYSDRRSGGGGGGGDFVAGFLLGGAIFGALGYVFAPQIRRSLLNEDEYGFRKPRRLIYYDDGLERTRETLNEKLSQLNSAIENVSMRLRGGNKMPPVPVETDPEEATM